MYYCNKMRNWERKRKKETYFANSHLVELHKQIQSDMPKKITDDESTEEICCLIKISDAINIHIHIYIWSDILEFRHTADKEYTADTLRGWERIHMRRVRALHCNLQSTLPICRILCIGPLSAIHLHVFSSAYEIHDFSDPVSALHLLQLFSTCRLWCL